MAWSFTVTIPDNIKDDIADAFADAYNFNKNGGGMTKSQFARSKVRQYIRDIFISYKVKVFNEDKAAVITTADSDSNSITAV